MKTPGGVMASSVPDSLPPEFDSSALRAYRRELPRLVDEGEQGRYALLMGDKLVSVWDTYRDALQAGYEKYGLNSPFAVQRIDARDLTRLGPADQPSAAAPSATQPAVA
jgi:hypothetical protein